MSLPSSTFNTCPTELSLRLLCQVKIGTALFGKISGLFVAPLWGLHRVELLALWGF